MSTSDLYVLNRKSTSWHSEFRNGWGSGPCIWDHLTSRYFPEVNFTDFNRVDYVGWDRRCRMAWGLADKASPITQDERVALMLTFDKSFVPVAHLSVAGQACRATHEMIVAHGFWTGVNHWQAIGDALIVLSEMQLHHQARGVVLNCTSVNDVWAHPSRDYLENAWPIFEDTTNANGGDHE